MVDYMASEEFDEYGYEAEDVYHDDKDTPWKDTPVRS